MAFVRNRNGSFNPDEAMDRPEFLAAVDIVHEFLLAGEGIS